MAASIDSKILKKKVDLTVEDKDLELFEKELRDYGELVMTLEREGEKRQAENHLETLQATLKEIQEQIENEIVVNDQTYGMYYSARLNEVMAKIYELVEVDLDLAVIHRTQAIRFSHGSKRLDNIVLAIINLQLLENVENVQKFMRFVQSIKENTIKQMSAETRRKRRKLKERKKPEKRGRLAFNFMLDLIISITSQLGQPGKDALNEATHFLDQLYDHAYVDDIYIYDRISYLLAIQEGMKAPIEREVDKKGFFKSTIVPFSLSERRILELQKRMEKYYHSCGVELPVFLSYVPDLVSIKKILPHITIIGRSGSGKTTFTKHMIRENLKIENTGAIILDRHREYRGMGSTIVEFDVKRSSKVKHFIDLKNMKTAYDKNVELMEKKINEEAASQSLEQTSERMHSVAVQSQLVLSNFIHESVKQLIAQHRNVLFDVKSGEEVIIWVNSGEATIDDVIINQLLERIFEYGTKETKLNTLLFVNEESHRIRDNEFVRRIASEGRKFGLVMVSVSQRPDFDEWVLGNSRPIIFNLNYQDVLTIQETFRSLQHPKIIPELAIGEYLALDDEWFISYMPEGLLDHYADETVMSRIEQYRKAKKRDLRSR